MTKKPKRTSAVAEFEPPPEPPESTALEPAPHMESYLEDVRTAALNRRGQLNAQVRDDQHDIQRTIEDLESWRNEIEATIAFLKAMRR
jgi:hypothetical protein